MIAFEGAAAVALFIVAGFGVAAIAARVLWLRDGRKARDETFDGALDRSDRDVLSLDGERTVRRVLFDRELEGDIMSAGLEIVTSDDQPEGDEWEPLFAITDDYDAQRQADELIDHQTEVDRLTRLLEWKLAQLEDWYQGATRSRRRRIAEVETNLAAYRRLLDETDPKRPAHYRLAAVTLKRVAGREKVEVTDEPAFIAAAKEHGHLELIRVTESVDKRAVQTWAKGRDENGVIFDGVGDGYPIPGARVIEGQVSYRAVIDKPKEPVNELAAVDTPALDKYEAES